MRLRERMTVDAIETVEIELVLAGEDRTFICPDCEHEYTALVDAEGQILCRCGLQLTYYSLLEG